jgi:hypothetical protein
MHGAKHALSALKLATTEDQTMTCFEQCGSPGLRRALGGRYAGAVTVAVARLSARLRRLVFVMAACIVAILGLGAVPAHAQDMLVGEWASTTLENGTVMTARDFPITPPPKDPTKELKGDVYLDVKGKHYIKFRGDGTFYPPPGAVIKLVGVQDTITIAAATGKANDFNILVDQFVTAQLAALNPLAPVLGTQFFALALPDALQLLGNEAAIWGETFRTTTQGVFGFEQGSTLLSILASTTADGQQAVRYDFDPSSAGLHLQLLLLALQGGDTLAGELVSGPSYQPNTLTRDFLVTGRVPEPSGLLLVGAALAVLAATASRRRS